MSGPSHRVTKLSPTGHRIATMLADGWGLGWDKRTGLRWLEYGGVGSGGATEPVKNAVAKSLVWKGVIVRKEEGKQIITWKLSDKWRKRMEDDEIKATGVPVPVSTLQVLQDRFGKGKKLVVNREEMKLVNECIGYVVRACPEAEGFDEPCVMMRKRVGDIWYERTEEP